MAHSRYSDRRGSPCPTRSPTTRYKISRLPRYLLWHSNLKPSPYSDRTQCNHIQAHLSSNCRPSLGTSPTSNPYQYCWGANRSSHNRSSWSSESKATGSYYPSKSTRRTHRSSNRQGWVCLSPSPSYRSI